jgi:hypothetical protein
LTRIVTWDRPAIEADTGGAPPEVTQATWDAYVIGAIRAWRSIPFDKVPAPAQETERISAAKHASARGSGDFKIRP